MKALVQRVREARVDIEGETAGAIGAGLLVLLCAERGDSERCASERSLCEVRDVIISVALRELSPAVAVTTGTRYRPFGMSQRPVAAAIRTAVRARGS